MSAELSSLAGPVFESRLVRAMPAIINGQRPRNLSYQSPATLYPAPTGVDHWNWPFPLDSPEKSPAFA